MKDLLTTPRRIGWTVDVPIRVVLLIGTATIVSAARMVQVGPAPANWRRRCLFCALTAIGLITLPGQFAAGAGAKPKAPSLKVRVLDPQGKPLADAKIHVSIWTEEKGFKHNRDYATDTAGTAEVELPKTYFIVRLWAGKEPFITMFANWEQNELSSGGVLPEEYTMQLESGVTAGGRIVDEQGKPVAGAKVRVMLRDNLKPVGGDGRMRYTTWLAEGSDAATTDADGRWQVDNVPNHPKAELRLHVSHPDYVSDEYGNQAQHEAGVTTGILLKGKATLTLRHGVIARGLVTDPDGKPIKGARIVRLTNVAIHVGSHILSEAAAENCLTDADGQFRLAAVRPGDTHLAVIAPGYASLVRQVDMKAGMPPQDFQMKPGKTIELRFVDVAAKPIPNVRVQIASVSGKPWFAQIEYPDTVRTDTPEKADENGVWRWSCAPDGPVELELSLKGYASRDLEISGGAPPRTVTLKSEHRITGRVTDALTGKPIPRFTIIQIDVFRKEWLNAERGNARVGKDGRLDYLARRTDIALRLRVEAMGYRNQTGPEFRVGDDSPRIQDFRLQPSPPVAGVVVDNAGKPVQNAEVLLATPTEEAELSPNSWGNHATSTDAAGRFSFPDPGEPFAVLARADAGFAMADFPADRHDAGTLRLRPWGCVRGRFHDGGKPVRNATVYVRPVRVDSLDRPRIDATFQTQTDADSRFEFPRVPPTPVSVRVSLGPWRDEGFRCGPSVPLDLEPGQKVELDLGGAGAVVNGKVKLVGNVPPDLDCTYSLNYLIRREPGITPPPEIAAAGFDVRKGWNDLWGKTREGSAYFSTLQYWFVKLAPDGGFRISGVPPGEYQLAIAIYAKPSGCLVDPLARKTVWVTVTPDDAARGKLTLPEIDAKVMPIPVVGDTPKLAFQLADGTESSLAHLRGRHMVVHFWASWCGPCRKQLPALRGLRDSFTPDKLILLGVSLDDDPAAWQTALGRLNLPWPQGRLPAAAASVSSVPTYWLLDPAGKIIAKASAPDELAKPLAERLSTLK